MKLLINLTSKKFNLKFLKYTTQAGGKIDTVKKIISNYEKSDIKLIIMYGASEATARMSFILERYQKKPDSIGKAIPGGELWLENEFGKKIHGNFEKGEIIYKGKNVCLGYAFNPQDLNKGNVII